MAAKVLAVEKAGVVGTLDVGADVDVAVAGAPDVAVV